jgi:8-oxo-dGTP diphosphatase
MTADAEFFGSKAVLICGDRLAVLRRDDIPEIPYPGLIDLPGGMREPGETPEACASRETFEEIGLRIETARYVWRAFKTHRPNRAVWVLAAHISEREAGALRLGDEGQACWMMELPAFLAAPDAIPHQQDWTREAFSALRPV